MLLELSYNNISWGTAIELPSSRALRTTTHVVGGKYPCRSMALIPRMILSEMDADGEPVKVLDPFMGSGTTAIEAALKGFAPYGLEVDPYAKLISNLSVHAFTRREIDKIARVREDIAKRFAACKGDESLAPTTHNIHHWFTKKNFEDLLKLKTLIHRYADHGHIERFFLAVLADIIRAASKAERQSLKPYISKRYVKKPNSVLPCFYRAFDTYFSAIVATSPYLKERHIQWIEGDATRFVASEKMDVAITSPPYMNAMDYVRCIKLESAWVGTGSDAVFSDLRKAQVGESARVKLKKITPTVREIATPYVEHLEKVDKPRFATAMTYFQDMHDNLICVRNALKKAGSYHLIIGNSMVRGVEVPTHEIIAKIGEEVGFSWDKYIRYPIKDHRTSLPRNGRGGKISEEHVVSLVKE